jgi:hypothetical protein
LCKPLEPEHLKQNYQETVMKRKPVPLTKEGKTGERIDTNTFVASAQHQVPNLKHFYLESVKVAFLMSCDENDLILEDFLSIFSERSFL